VPRLRIWSHAAGRYATNVDRVAHAAELDAAIEAWTRTLTAEQLLAAAKKAGVCAQRESSPHSPEPARAAC
jgi:crotonobetainyl-CoA:carnitine CoA-transferase CaiB-like acyl-CoA transferase